MALYTYNKQQFNSDISINNANTEFISTNHINISGGVINVFGPSTHTDNIYLSTDNTFSVGMKDPNTSYFGYGISGGDANINMDSNGNTKIDGSGTFYVNTSGGMNITGGFTSLMYITTKIFSFSPKVNEPTPSRPIVLSDLTSVRVSDGGIIKFIGKISNGGLIQLYIIDSVIGLSQKNYGMGTYVNICCNARNTSQPSLQFYGMSRESGSPGFSQYKFYYYSDTLSNTWIWFTDYTTNGDFSTDNNVTYTIRIYSNNPSNFYPDATDGSAYLNSAKEITNGIYILDNRFGINKTTPAVTMALDVSGNAYINGNTTLGNGFTVKYANDTLQALRVDPTTGILNVNNILTLASGLQVNYNKNGTTTKVFEVNDLTGNTNINSDIVSIIGNSYTVINNVTYDKSVISGAYSLITSLSGPNSSRFGNSCSLSSNGLTLAIGAPIESSFTGAVYIYSRTNISQAFSTTYTTRIPGTADSFFGSSCVLSSDGLTLVVGAYYESSYSGAVYIYIRTSTSESFSTTATTKLPGASSTQFGYSCALSNDGLTMAIGAPYEGSYFGAVYIYSRTSTSDSFSTLNKKRIPSSKSNSLGSSCALSGDGLTLAVGATSENYTTGAVYIYSRLNTTENFSTTATRLYNSNSMYFGISCSISSDGLTLLAGGYYESSDGSWENSQTGAVYIYSRTSIYDSFSTTATTRLPGVSSSQFGYSCAISSNGLTLVVGAPIKSSSTGAVYVYTRTSTSETFSTTANQSLTGVLNSQFGISCSLSSDGLVLVVGGSGVYNSDLSIYIGAGAYVYSKQMNTFALSVNGNSNVNGNSTVSGNTNVTGILTVSNNSTLSGNVGIGTTPSTYKLDVAGNAHINNELYLGQSNRDSTIYMGGGAEGDNGFDHSAIETRRYANSESTELLIFKGNDGDDRIRLKGGYIAFDINNCIYETNWGLNRTIENIQMVLNSTGLGIGTTGPDGRLHVNGRVRFSGLDSGTASQQLYIDGNNLVTKGALNQGPKGDQGVQGVQGVKGDTGQSGYYPNIYNSGNNIGIGTSSPAYPLQITSSVNGYGLYCETGIQCSTLITVSDKRIKTNIADIDDDYALSILRKIQPKTYDYVDKVKRGFNNVIGFIAQEIKEIIPSAVDIIKDYIPNFYTLCHISTTDVSNILRVMTDIDISWNPLHDLSRNPYIDMLGNACSDASGNKCFNIKLYDQSSNEIKCKTTNIIDKKTFLIDISGINISIDNSGETKVDPCGNIINQKNIFFLYGQEVDDFHTIDKPAIFTVVTAAVQDIDRHQQEDAVKINSLETIVSTLEQNNSIFENLVATLETKNNDLKSTVTILESQCQTDANKMSELENQFDLLQKQNIISQFNSLQQQNILLQNELSELKTQMNLIVSKLSM